MKNYLFASVCGAVLFTGLFSGVGIVLAQVSISTSTEATTLDENKYSQTQGKETSNKALTLAKQKRITNLAANISNRTDAAIQRLQDISKRIDRRIQKLEKEGYILDSSKVSVTEASTALAQAGILMREIDEDVVAAVTSEQPAAQWKSVRATFIKAKAELLNAKSALGDALLEIKQTVAKGVVQQTASSSGTRSATVAN